MGRQRDDPYKPRRRKELQALGPLVPKVLGELGLSGATAILRVTRVWEAAVGPELARHCQPVQLRGSVLDVRVGSSTRAQEVSLRRNELLAGLRRELGDAAPTDLRVQLG